MRQPFYYHSNDPIENLRIKVTIRRLKDGDKEKKTQTQHKSRGNQNRRKKEQTEAGASNASTGKNQWSLTFKWQQKAFSPGELCKYLPEDDGGKRKKLHRRVEVEYHEELVKRTNQKETIIEKEDSVVIFSYTDKDGYVPDSAFTSSVSTSNNIPTELEAAIMEMPLRGESARRKHYSYKGNMNQGPAGHLAREGSYRIMYLMATVDIHPDDYKEKKPEFDDQILCVIKQYSNGMLEATPGFSETLDEFTDPYALSKGEKLSTTLFNSKRGVQYEYTIENLSAFHGDVDAALARELKFLEIQSDAKEVAKWSNRCSSHIIDQPPKPFDARALINLEIVSGYGFSGNMLYVQYETIIPDQGWSWDSNETPEALQLMKHGCTQSACTVSRKSQFANASPTTTASIAHFGFPVELSLLKTTYSNPLLAGKSVQLLLQVFSRDSWERNYVEGYAFLNIPSISGFYDITISTWRPIDTIRSQMKDFFVGGSSQIMDAEYISNQKTNGVNASFLSKFGFKVTSGGKIRMRCNIREQRANEEDIVQTQSLVIKRGISDILSSLKGFRSKISESRRSSIEEDQ